MCEGPYSLQLSASGGPISSHPEFLFGTGDERARDLGRSRCARYENGRESRGERENARRQRKKFHCYGHRRENVREKAEEGAKDGPTTVKGTRLRKENGRIRIYNLTTVILLKYSLHQVIRMFSILEQLQSAWGLGHLKVFLTYSTPRLCVQGTLAGLL